MDHPTLGDLRRKKRLTLRQAALAMGIRPSTLCSYETGRRIPNIVDALAIAAFYHRDPRRIDWQARSRLRRDKNQEVS